MTPEFSAAAMDARDNGAVFSSVRATIKFESGLLYTIRFNSSLRVKSIEFLIYKDLENLPYADSLKIITNKGKINSRGRSRIKETIVSK